MGGLESAESGSGRLHKAQLQAGGVGHFIHGPGGIEDDFELDLCDTGDCADGLLDLPGKGFGDGTVGRGQRHIDLDGSIVARVEPIDETEFVNVNGEFGIEDFAQGGDDRLVKRGGGIGDRVDEFSRHVTNLED